MWGGVRRCGEVWGDVGRCGEVWGGVCWDVGLCTSQNQSNQFYFCHKLLSNVSVSWRCCYVLCYAMHCVYGPPSDHMGL